MKRLDLIDGARGVALIAMGIYHLSWNLRWFGLVDWNVDTHPAWRLFAALIAGSFLALVGVSMVLAHDGGVRWEPALKRILKVSVAALAVSAATYLALDDLYVRFGILHAIALGSLIAILLVPLPSVVLVFVGALALVLPLTISASFPGDRWFIWSGLIDNPPLAVDFVPILPWLGVILLAMAATRLVRHREIWSRLSDWRTNALFGRGLSWAGRHSLAIYLLHQPVLFGAVWLATTLFVTHDPAQRAFVENCVTSCSVAQDAGSCLEICNCTVDALSADGTWTALVERPYDPELNERLSDQYRFCSAPSRPAD